MVATGQRSTLVIAQVGARRGAAWQRALERYADIHDVEACIVGCDRPADRAAHERSVRLLRSELFSHGDVDILAVGAAAGPVVSCVGEHTGAVRRLVLCNPHLCAVKGTDLRPWRAAAQQVDVPVLILAGLGFGPSTRDARALSRLLPQGTLCWAPYLGPHWMSQSPGYLASQVERFLRRDA